MRRERGPYRYQRMQILEGFINDAYRSARKPRGPMQCPRCGTVFRRGRWSWGAAPAGARRSLCPACRRIEERYPAGYVNISGSFSRAHRDEILQRVRNCEAREKAEHPLERIMAIETVSDGVLVSTTSVHLARMLAHRLQQSFKGDLSVSYNKEDNLLRARWSRER